MGSGGPRRGLVLGEVLHDGVLDDGRHLADEDLVDLQRMFLRGRAHHGTL